MERSVRFGLLLSPAEKQALAQLAEAEGGVSQGATSAPFSFRWGIPLLDGGFTNVPNFFFDHYTEAGVSRMEFLTILHLARYRFERPDSECRPSIPTVARQMGYSVRGLRKVLAGLEERALLARHHRPGKATIYDFSGFSRAVLATAQAVDHSNGETPEPQFTPESQFRGTSELQFRPPRNPSSHEEEKEQQARKKDGGGGDLTSEQRTLLNLLVHFGVSEPVARHLARTRDPADVRGWLDYAQRANGLQDPSAFVVRRLLDGEPASPESDKGNGRHSGTTTANCPSCYLVRPVECICFDCGQCWDCCTCA